MQMYQLIRDWEGREESEEKLRSFIHDMANPDSEADALGWIGTQHDIIVVGYVAGHTLDSIPSCL